MKKKTRLLPDLPVDSDEFGPHGRLAAELQNLVQTQPVESEHIPHSVALLGDWGSGKSSVVRMLRTRLRKGLREGQKPQVETFLYDAWVHEGDGLRRAFLDSMRIHFDALLTDEQRETIRKGVWDKHESTTTTKQPILRRHGKLLIISLLLVPAGLRLFGAYPADWNASLKWIWDTSTLAAIVAPLVVSVLLFYLKEMLPLSFSQWIFGVKDQGELDDLKISSFFLQKTEGEVEHHWKTDAADSIQQFRDAFLNLCGIVLGENRKLLIVVDNLDRLDRDEARAFWSTMQSFFDRTGWRANGVADRVWLLVPFSPMALEKVFAHGESEEARSEYRSFIDKSFDLSLTVPPPIQVESRRFLLTQLKLAFPEHSHHMLENVRNLFDRDRSEGHAVGRAGDARATRKTPREMKLFINQLVALYRVQGEESALEVLAAYLLIRDKIAKDGIAPDSQLSAYQLSILPKTPDRIQQLASVHFGVSLADAAQVVLSEPLRAALEDAEIEQLRPLASQSGFVDVLENVVADVGSRTVSNVFTKVSALEGLEISRNTELKATWNILSNELLNVQHLGSITDRELGGLQSLHDLLVDDQRQNFLDIVRSGLESRWVQAADTRIRADNETDDVFEKRMANAASWARLQQKLQSISGARYAPVSLPYAAQFTVRVLDALSGMAGTPAKGIRVRADVNLAAKAIANWPGNGSGPQDPIEFVRTVGAVNDWKLPWNEVAKSIVLRFDSNMESGLAIQSMTMLFAIASVAQSPAAQAAILESVTNGRLDSAVADAGSTDEAKATALAMIILHAPHATPVAIDARNRQTESILSAVLNGSDAGQVIIDASAEYIHRVYMGRVALTNISSNPDLYVIGAKLISKLIDRQYSFQPSRAQFLKWNTYLEQYLEEGKIEIMLKNLGNTEALAGDFAKAPLGKDSERPTYWLLKTIKGNESKPLRSQVQRYAKSLSAQEWKEALIDKEGLRLKLSDEVRSSGYRIAIGVNLADAIFEVLQLGEISSLSSPLRTRIPIALRILSDDVKSNLPARIWDAVNGMHDVNRVESIVDLVGDIMIDVSAVSSTSAINNALRELVLQPKSRYVTWMTNLLTKNRGWLDSATAATSEFRARINEKLRITSGVDGETKRALRALKGHLPQEQPRERKKRKDKMIE